MQQLSEQEAAQLLAATIAYFQPLDRTAALSAHKSVNPFGDSSVVDVVTIDAAVRNMALHFLNAQQALFPSDLGGLKTAAHMPVAQEQFLNDLAVLVQQAIKVHAPTFAGHMTSALPNYVPSLMYLLGALNQNSVKYETSGQFGELERAVIRFFYVKLFKVNPDDETAWRGCFCSGATIGNLTALWAMRKFWQATQQSQLQTGKVYVSELGHYSLYKSLDILGFNPEQLCTIPLNTRGSIDIAALSVQLVEDAAAGIQPLALIAIAGATETGTIDALEAIAALARQYQAWMHVDAAWGGAFCLSQANGQLLAGIEQADSVVIDAHKQLYVPIGCGMVLFANSVSAERIRYHAEYIIRPDSTDNGRYTLEGSRPVLCLILHCHLQLLGVRGLGLLLDRQCELAAQFAHWLKSQDDFEVTTAPVLNILTYRYVPKETQVLLKRAGSSTISRAVLTPLFDALDRLTVMLHKRQRHDGASFVSRTQVRSWATSYSIMASDQSINKGIVDSVERFPKMVVLRVVLANPLTTLGTLQNMVKSQRELVITQAPQQLQQVLKLTQQGF